MKIRIPHTLARACDAFGDWANVPIWRYEHLRRGTGIIEFRRIDIILALGFVFSVSWYGVTMGWQGAVMGGVMYLAVAAMALWIL